MSLHCLVKFLPTNKDDADRIVETILDIELLGVKWMNSKVTGNGICMINAQIDDKSYVDRIKESIEPYSNKIQIKLNNSLHDLDNEDFDLNLNNEIRTELIHKNGLSGMNGKHDSDEDRPSSHEDSPVSEIKHIKNETNISHSNFKKTEKPKLSNKSLNQENKRDYKQLDRVNDDDLYVESDEEIDLPDNILILNNQIQRISNYVQDLEHQIKSNFQSSPMSFNIKFQSVSFSGDPYIGESFVASGSILIDGEEFLISEICPIGWYRIRNGYTPKLLHEGFRYIVTTEDIGSVIQLRVRYGDKLVTKNSRQIIIDPALNKTIKSLANKNSEYETKIKIVEGEYNGYRAGSELSLVISREKIKLRTDKKTLLKEKYTTHSITKPQSHPNYIHVHFNKFKLLVETPSPLNCSLSLILVKLHPIINTLTHYINGDYKNTNIITNLGPYDNLLLSLETISSHTGEIQYEYNVPPIDEVVPRDDYDEDLYQQTLDELILPEKSIQFIQTLLGVDTSKKEPYTFPSEDEFQLYQNQYSDLTINKGRNALFSEVVPLLLETNIQYQKMNSIASLVVNIDKNECSLTQFIIIKHMCTIVTMNQLQIPKVLPTIYSLYLSQPAGLIQSPMSPVNTMTPLQVQSSKSLEQRQLDQNVNTTNNFNSVNNNYNHNIRENNMRKDNQYRHDVSNTSDSDDDNTSHKRLKKSWDDNNNSNDQMKLSDSNNSFNHNQSNAFSSSPSFSPQIKSDNSLDDHIIKSKFPTESFNHYSPQDDRRSNDRQRNSLAISIAHDDDPDEWSVSEYELDMFKIYCKEFADTELISLADMYPTFALSKLSPDEIKSVCALVVKLDKGVCNELEFKMIMHILLNISKYKKNFPKVLPNCYKNIITTITGVPKSKGDFHWDIDTECWLNDKTGWYYDEINKKYSMDPRNPNEWYVMVNGELKKEGED